MKKLLICLITGVAFAMSICVYASCVQKDIGKNVIRFHVKANSDTEYDQKIKLMVRDEINTYLSPLLADSKNIYESHIIIRSNLDEIETLANEALAEAGADYSATVSLGEKDFPTKRYENVTLPAGRYNALCIDLGNADGENWWCVMFPPLCLNNSILSLPESSQAYLKQNLNEDSFAIINTDEDNFTTVYRFKIFDLFSSLFN